MSGRASAVILLTGAHGQIGWELRRALAPLGRVAAAGRAELDLADAASIRAAVRGLAPRMIVNAAAYTAVDRAEAELELAHRVNAEAPGVLADEAARTGAVLVHYSTDYVFDGEKRSPYLETDAPAPVNAYGRSKLAGEEAVRSSGARHLVLRTSWIYGTRGSNFLGTMLRLAREREELRVVSDQTGSPTWSRMVAEATALALGSLRAGDDPLARAADVSGTYHLTAAGATSWHAFAERILETDPRREEQRCRSIVPIATSEYPTPARRPSFSVLSNDRFADAFGLRLPPWEEQLAMALAG